MEQTKKTKPLPTAYREVQMNGTIYHITSIFLGEKDLGQTLEQLAIRKAMTDIKAGAECSVA